MPESSPTNFILDARREILKHGVVVDALLAADPDRPVFGFNLACAYPFPAPAASPRWTRQSMSIPHGRRM
jgi:hypothetical protein